MERHRHTDHVHKQWDGLCHYIEMEFDRRAKPIACYKGNTVRVMYDCLGHSIEME